MSYFDYENPRFQAGFTKITSNKKEWCKKNIGATICVLTRGGYDPVRGYMSPMYGVISGYRYSQIYLDDFARSFDIRDVLEIAYKNAE